MRSYKKLITLPTFDERFKYLMLKGHVGEETFGIERYLNQKFYRSKEWKQIRRDVIVRDDGCDLAIDGEQIGGMIFIHHINPITIDDIKKGSKKVFDLNNLVCVSKKTHEAIHYGNEDYIYYTKPVVRKPNDTCPWKGE